MVIDRPLLLDLDGVLEPTAAAARAHGFDVTSIGFLGRDPRIIRFVGVTRARTVGGDPPLDGKDVLRLVAPYTPSLLVTGEPALVARLHEAPDGATIRVEGRVGRGSRTYLLRHVEVGQASAP